MPIVLCFLLLCFVGTANAAPWQQNLNSAERYANERQGKISFGIIDDQGKLRGRHVDRVHYSASVVKTMMMVSWLRRARDRALTRKDKRLLRPMITKSADEPANYIYTKLGAKALEGLARRAKMRKFSTQPVWGHSTITVRDQARFMWRLKRYIPKRHQNYAFRLLRSITASQRWGVFDGAKNWHVYAKGGFVNPGKWRINQVAQLRKDGHKLSIVILTEGNPSLNYGAKTIAAITKRLLKNYSAVRALK
jgi:hypothetical protein